MYPKHILSCSIAALLTISAGAATVGTFDGAGETFGTAFKQSTDPLDITTPSTIETGGPTGNFLRLTHEQGGQSNHYAFNAENNGDTGNWSTLTGQFDFRITNTTGDPADGLGFLFIPVARTGILGEGLRDFAAEEPNTAGTLAMGLDMYPHGSANDVSLHWNGLEQVNANTSKTLLDYVNSGGSGWNNAKVTYTQVGNGLNAKVEITKDVYGAPTTFTRIEQAIDARPYAYRVQIGARTGGAVMTTDVDNIGAEHSGSAANLPVIDPGKYAHQDFDSLGASTYVARLHSLDGVEFRQGPKLVGTGGSGGGAYMQLAQDGQNSILSSIVMTRTADGGIAPTRHVEVDFRMANPDGATPADGMGILLLPTSGFGVISGGATPNFEAPSVTNGLSIGFQVYEAGNRINRVHLNWNGQDTVLNPDIATLDLLNGTWNRLKVETEVAPGGSNVSLSVIQDVNGAAVSIPLFTDQFIAGMAPYDYRVQVGARTGGLNIQADVDNIRTFAKASSFVNPNNTTVQGFDGPGTFYQATDRHGFDGGTDATRHAAILSGGPSGNFLRLVHAVNSQNANIGFNQTIPSGTPKPLVESSFDFRMQGDAGINRADGFAFGLFDVNTYGTTGGILDGSLDWETVGLASALTLAFDIYDGNPGTTTDALRLIWNGNKIDFGLGVDDFFTAFDLNNDLFHHAKLTLLDIGTDTSATLTLTQDAFGAANVFPVFTDLIIPGLDMDTFDFRAGFGARTGGANADMDIDNVQVVPEPGSAALLLGGLTLLARRRKRRAN